MFGENGFGTIRFGESPAARSPVLLSGRSVQDGGTTTLRIGAGRCAASSTTTAGSASVRILRTVALGNVAPQAWLVSGCGIGSGAALSGRSGVTSSGEGIARTSRGVVSSQKPMSVAEIRATATSVLAGRDGEFPLVSGSAMRAGRRLGIRGWGQEDGPAEMTIYRVLASGQGVTPLGTIRLLAATTLASGSGVQTVSWGDFAFPGLVLRVVQGGNSQARPATVKYGAGRGAAGTNTLQAGMLTPGFLAGFGVTWCWSRGGIQGAGLLILNIQGAGEFSRLRAERRAGSRSVEGTGTPALRIRIERLFRVAGWGEETSRVVVAGRVFVVWIVQEGRGAGRLPTGRSLKGGGTDRSDKNAGITINRIVGGEGREGVAHRIILLAPAVLAGQNRQPGELRILLGRLRTLDATERDWLYSFGRFAVIPDLRNDRVVVIFGEKRAVIIPKQSEL